jgi:hypothetical protein
MRGRANDHARVRTSACRGSGRSGGVVAVRAGAGPSESPTGTGLALRDERGRDGSQPLSSRPGIIRSRPSWAPDGSRLVAEVVYSQEFGLWQFDARRAAARNLTEGESGL